MIEIVRAPQECVKGWLERDLRQMLGESRSASAYSSTLYGLGVVQVRCDGVLYKRFVFCVVIV